MGDVLTTDPSASPARIHLVASAAPNEGRGHSARALALAEAFADRGVHPTLELRRGTLTERQAAGFARFGVRRAVEPTGAVVVADLPDPNEDAGAVPDRLVVFDDRDVFAGDAAIVVQPSLPRWTGRPGAHAARVLAGYEYVPIAGEIRAAGVGIRTDRGARRVVVCFGGSDPEDVTARLGAAILDLPTAETIVIVGTDYRGTFAARSAEVLRDPPGFVDLLASADLVVGSAGTMKFELAALGRPMILVAAADNQMAVGAAFAATGAARYLGDGRTIDAAVVRAAVIELLGDDRRRAVLGARGGALIDGGGAARIVDAALALAGSVG